MKIKTILIKIARPVVSVFQPEWPPEKDLNLDALWGDLTEEESQRFSEAIQGLARAMSRPGLAFTPTVPTLEEAFMDWLDNEGGWQDD